ncbi:1938_t:CDS:1, partial [Entrophospora sp. SA101]
LYIRKRKMTNPISLKCCFPDGKYFNIEICKEDKVTTLKKAIEGLLVNQGHQELSIHFNLYAIIPMESTAEVSEYFNATKQVHVIVKPKK